MLVSGYNVDWLSGCKCVWVLVYIIMVSGCVSVWAKLYLGVLVSGCNFDWVC